MTATKVTQVQLPATRNDAPDTTPMSMLDRAVASGASVEVLEKLMGLQERYETNQARKAFDNAMSAAKAEIPIISKNRQVGFENRGGNQTTYKHEDMAEIARTIDPIIAKHGLSYRFRTTSEVARVIVTCVVTHRDGHSEENSLSSGHDGSGGKNAIQGLGSALTYLQRYALKAAFGLAASADDDGQGAGLITRGTTAPTPKAAVAPSQPVDGPHKIVGGTYAGWTDGFIAAVQTADDNSVVMAWVDANQQQLDKLAKGSPEDAARAKAAVAKHIEFLRKTAPQSSTDHQGEVLQDMGEDTAAPPKTAPKARRTGSKVDFTKHYDAAMAYVLDRLAHAQSPDEIESVWDEYVEPHWDTLMPPDKEELQGARRQAEGRLEV
jgi:ERF superfamily